ncbi:MULTISPECIES: hypothetical protein [Streptomyces]
MLFDLDGTLIDHEAAGALPLEKLPAPGLVTLCRWRRRHEGCE